MKDIILLDKDGNKFDYKILFSFDIEKNNKTYIIYTDNSKDSDGKLNFYRACYLINDNSHHLLPIETQEENNLIDSLLVHVKKYII